MIARLYEFFYLDRKARLVAYGWTVLLAFLYGAINGVLLNRPEERVSYEAVVFLLVVHLGVTIGYSLWGKPVRTKKLLKRYTAAGYRIPKLVPYLAGVSLLALMASVFIPSRNVYAAIMDYQISKLLPTVPNQPSSAIKLTNIFDTAKRENIPISLQVIQNAGTKVFASPKPAPQTWEAKIALINYRSLLNSQKAPSPSIDASTINWKAGPLLSNPPLVLAWGDAVDYPADAGMPFFITFSGPVLPVPEAAHYVPIGGMPINAENLMGPVGHQYIFIQTKAHILMDNYDMQNVVIKDAFVVYRDNNFPPRLANVYFVNCTFEMTQGPQAEELAKALLNQSPTNFPIPHEP